MKSVILRPEVAANPNLSRESGPLRLIQNHRIVFTAVSLTVVIVFFIAADLTVRSVFSRLDQAIHERYLRGANIPDR